MRPSPPCLAVLSAIAALGATSPASAARQRQQVQVLAVSSDRGYEQAQALTIALKRAVDRSRAHALGPGDYSLEVLVLALGCKEPPDSECQSRIAQKANAERYVWGTLEIEGAEVVAHLRYWEGDAQKGETIIRYASNLTDPSDDVLLEVARNAFAELTGAPSAVLVLRVGDHDGEVLVDGAPAGALRRGRAELLVPSGEHEVTVRIRGRADRVERVDVQSARQELTLAPGAALARRASPPERPASVGPAASEDPDRTLAWVALGGGGLLLGGGVYSALRVASIAEDERLAGYRASLPPSKDACEEAKQGRRSATGADPQPVADLCHEADVLEPLQFVLLGLGAVGVGAGAWLLLEGDPAPRAGVRVRTRTSADGARLEMQVTF